jgi:hypothetical protein
VLTCTSHKLCHRNGPIRPSEDLEKNILTIAEINVWIETGLSKGYRNILFSAAPAQAKGRQSIQRPVPKETA